MALLTTRTNNNAEQYIITFIQMQHDWIEVKKKLYPERRPMTVFFSVVIFLNWKYERKWNSNDRAP